MANDDLPPSLRTADDLPPSMRGADDLPPSMRTQSMIQKAAQASGMPMRGLRGVGVGVEKMFTGNEKGFIPRVGEAAQSASEATQPDYVPKPGEKIGAMAGEMADPRFLALGGVGEMAATAPVLKAAFAGAAALGGVQAIEDTAQTGQVDPKKAGIAAAEGAAGGAVLHGAVKGVAAIGGKAVDVVGKMIDSALGPEVEHGFSETMKPKAPSPTEDFLKGKTAGPPAPIIDPKALPPKPEMVIASDISASEATGKFLDRMKRAADGMPTSIDLAMKNTGSLAWEYGPKNAGEMADAVAPLKDLGKSVADISNETGVPKKSVQAASNLNPPIDTSELKLQHAASQGDPQAQLSVLQKAFRYWTGSSTEASSMAKNLYKRRYGDIGVGYFDSRLFVRDSVGHLSDVQRQALPFIIEGKLPEPTKFLHPQAQEILDTATRFMQNPNDPAMRDLLVAQDKIGKYYDEGHEFLKKNFDEIGYKDNYVNHLWERNPQTSEYGPSGASLSQKNPFAKKRFIASYADGINQGLTPKTLDMADLLKTYDNYKIKTVANMRFREGIGDIRVEGGKPAVLPVSEAPPDWKYIDSNFFTGLKVHPEVYDAVRAIVDKPFAFSEPGPNAPFSQKAFHSVINAYDYLNAYTKKVRLSVSLFHHFSLTETAFGGGTNPLKVMKDQALNIWNNSEYEGLKDLPAALYKSFKEGHAAFNDLPMARDAIQHGLQIGSISDVQRGTVTKGLLGAEEKLKGISPLASKVFQGVRTFNELWDKSLWDYYHAGIKLQMYEDHLTQNIKAFGEKMEPEAIKRETADFINKATGGALETMMYSPKYRQALHWAMLAPDWTITRLQTAGTIFKTGPQGYQGRKFWLKAGVTYFSTANILNYVNTQKYLGKGRFIWENDPGKTYHVFLKKDDQGRNVYIMPAKTLVEVVGWFEHPIQTLGAKAAPAIQMMAEALQKGNRTLTGFNIPDDQKGVGQFLKRNITPFSMQKSNLAFTFPLSRGISKTQVIEMLQSGIEKGDEKSLQTALKFGIENGYDVGTLKNIALKNVRGKLKKSAMASDE